MARLFVAMDPPDDVRAELAGIRFDLRGVRWLPPEQYHLTLRFLGDAPHEQVVAVSERLRGISGPEVELDVEGIDVFPSRRRPRVLVVRLSEVPALRALQSNIEEAMEDLGFRPEDRPFTSHITLARFREVDTRRLEYLIESASVPPLRFGVDAFYLYESVLLPEGARYTRLSRYGLESEAADH